MFSLGNISDSDNERYKANLAKKRAEAEAPLREQEQKERCYAIQTFRQNK